MKHFLLIALVIGFLPNIFAVERCPIYRESGWKLVRRTTENSFAATDNLDGTDVYGPEHQNVLGRFDTTSACYFTSGLFPAYFRINGALPLNWSAARKRSNHKRRVFFNRLHWYWLWWNAFRNGRLPRMGEDGQKWIRSQIWWCEKRYWNWYESWSTSTFYDFSKYSR